MERKDVFRKGGIFLHESVEGFGTPSSKSIEYLRHLGFKPIKITVLACEETFCFETEAESIAASEAFNGETGNWGWWYGLDGKYPWDETEAQYTASGQMSKVWDLHYTDAQQQTGKKSKS